MTETTHVEHLFGRIAVACGYVSHEDVDRAVEVQKSAAEPRHLGYIMLDMGLLDAEQLMTVLAVQREHRARIERSQPAEQASATLGELAVGLGWATMQQVHECIEEQAKLERFKLFFRLGEVMVSRGVLSIQQVQELLSRQQVTILGCPGCFSRFNVAAYDPKREELCPKCGTGLRIPASLESVKVDGEIGAPRRGS